MLAFSKNLPVKIGSYDPERARQFGMEIRRMGGEVSLRRIEAQPPAPADTPGGGGRADSWVVHGHSESQDELRSMTGPGQSESDSPRTTADYSGVFDDTPRTIAPPPPKRTIGGKFEAKQLYTADQKFGLTEERFEKVKGLYAGKEAK
jgi:hypothetical protein